MVHSITPPASEVSGRSRTQKGARPKFFVPWGASRSGYGVGEKFRAAGPAGPVQKGGPFMSVPYSSPTIRRLPFF